ncbi:hypothetical protein [Glacieibacterium frigidum]|uniref:Uncharacterized protein n=1 Tax=Glacieibacterium frigidum TaxID=2593303 RepID=A0A552UFZ5_9SPHN|nr:hypothetical protein [Glacieibacterium frigidum]TRW17124.1 hypothetical protein FMM06_02680 [Glacieibacterium frigidum]
MIRLLAALWLACAAAANAQISVGSGDGPRGWVDAADGPRLAAADIALPRTLAGFQLQRRELFAGQQFDGFANYNDGSGSFVTVYIYQPSRIEPRLNWLAVRQSMAARFGDGTVSGVEQRLTVPRGELVLVQQPGKMDATPVSELVALAVTSHGWIIKIRVTSVGDAARTQEIARAAATALVLPAKVTLVPIATGGFPDCSVRVVAAPPVDVPRGSAEDETASDLMAALTLATVSVTVKEPDRCRLPTVKTAFGVFVPYRSRAATGPVDYIATIGDSGTTAGLRADLSRPGVTSLSFDTADAHTVFKRVRGDVDDADFMAFLAALPDMFDAPPLSVVKRR